MMICVKIHKAGDEVLLAACDKELLGTTLEDSKISLKVTREFYFQREVTPEEFSKLLEKATIANLVGNTVVEKAVSLQLVDSKNVLEISGVKHAQLVLI